VTCRALSAYLNTPPPEADRHLAPRPSRAERGIRLHASASDGHADHDVPAWRVSNCLRLDAAHR
jgi:hypothetical protein